MRAFLMNYIPYIVSITALLFSVYQFIKATEKEDTTQLTTLLIKLENISDGVNEIKKDMRSLREDVQTLRERIAKAEASIASAHKRVDILTGTKNDDR